MLLLLLISEVIEENNAISYEDGNILFEKISNVIKNKGLVELDFSGIKSLTTTFLTASIGQLYEQYSDDIIDRTLTYKNLNDDYKEILHEVITRSKEFKNNSSAFEDIVDNMIYGD